jgi:hypothetical protein
MPVNESKRYVHPYLHLQIDILCLTPLLHLNINNFSVLQKTYEIPGNRRAFVLITRQLLVYLAYKQIFNTQGAGVMPRLLPVNKAAVNMLGVEHYA